MASPIALQSFEMYTVGWIAALAIERAAAIAMLEEKHAKPLDFTQSPSDTNSYTWGRIGSHNIVICSLAAGVYGLSSAATTAPPMLQSFPNIRIGLMVGIGGGNPDPENGRDIRLGDVVVSQPQGRSGGVVQYDLGKAKEGKWERKDFLSRPPEVLLKALSCLQAQHELEGSRMQEFLDEAVRLNPRLAKTKNGYIHQGVKNDHLFPESYPHTLGVDCRNCDMAEAIDREERESAEPEIHYGVIASGNTLIKDAAVRRKIVEDIDEDILCFEMEAAGLMNNFPCLVIRGISDYSDSHKNDRWQRYASATAAAFAKELLGYIPGEEVQRTTRAGDVLEIFSEKMEGIQWTTTATQAAVEAISAESQHMQTFSWIAPADPSSNFNEAKRKRHHGTGQWFLDSAPFREWKEGIRRSLWLYGIPGSGKTILSSTIIEHLQETQGDSQAVLNFFFDFSHSDKQSLNKLIRTLIMQLYNYSEDSRRELDDLWRSCKEGLTQPSIETLTSTFQNMTRHVDNIRVVVDALDECATRKELLDWLKLFFGANSENIFLLVTSRKEEDIESSLRSWIREEDSIGLKDTLVDSDIRSYVHETLRQENGFRRWQSIPSVLDEIEEKLMEKSTGMFRWAACQLNTLEECLDLRKLRKTLASLPATLAETYDRILINIRDEHKNDTIRILQLLAYGPRPLRLEEAVDVIAIDPDENPPFDRELRMPIPREILKVCSSLVVLLESQNYQETTVYELQLSHLSVKEYVVSGKSVEGFQQFLSESFAKSTIARISLAYISQVSPNRVEDFPFANFSARYLLSYARYAEADEVAQSDLLQFFLQKDDGYKNWGRLFNPESSDRLSWRSQEMATPLYNASLAGLTNTVRLLLREGADVNDGRGFRGSPLQVAAFHNHKDVVRVLLQNGADVNLMSGYSGTALAAACAAGHKEIAEILLDAGADTDAGQHRFPLQIAAWKGRTDIAKMLIDRGADVNAKADTVGSTSAIRCAVANGHLDTIQLLLEQDVNESDLKESVSVAWLHGLGSVLLLFEKKNRNLVSGLGEGNWKSAFSTLRQKYYGGQFQKAIRSGDTEEVRSILKNGYDVNKQEGYYGNALQTAVYTGDKSEDAMIRLLLDAGADINQQGGAFGNALQAACARGHKKAVRLLLEKGVDVNASGGYYPSALEAARMKGRHDIVNMLVEAGAVEQA